MKSFLSTYRKKKKNRPWPNAKISGIFYSTSLLGPSALVGTWKTPPKYWKFHNFLFPCPKMPIFKYVHLEVYTGKFVWLDRTYYKLYCLRKWWKTPLFSTKIGPSRTFLGTTVGMNWIFQNLHLSFHDCPLAFNFCTKCYSIQSMQKVSKH